MNKIRNFKFSQRHAKDGCVIFVYRSNNVKIYYPSQKKANKLLSILGKSGLERGIFIQGDGSITISHRQ